MENFLAEIKIIKKSLKNEEKEQYKPSFVDAMWAIIQDKFIDYCEENDIDDDFEYGPENKGFIKEIVKGAIKNKTLKNIHDSISVRLGDEGEPELHSENEAIKAFIARVINNAEGGRVFEKQDMKIRTAVIFMCIAFENLCSEIIRYQYKNNKKFRANLADKQLSLSDLKEIGDVEAAEDLLIEQELDSFFRPGFLLWFEKIDDKFGIIKTFDLDNKLQLVNELYQRRNLYVHSNGKVNGIYLKNVSDSKLKKGENLPSDVDYVEEIIDVVTEIAWYIYFKHLCIKNDGINMTTFDEMNGILLSSIKSNNPAIPNIYKKFEECGKNDFQKAKLMSFFNRCLFYKSNNRLDEIKEEVEKFNTSCYDTEYKMARAVILESDEAYDLTEKYLYSLESVEALGVLSWPIFDSVRDKPNFKDLFSRRLDEIFSF